MQNFTPILIPLKILTKMYKQKVISKIVRKMCTFSTFTHVCQSCFAYNLFLVNFLKSLSMDFKSV